MIKSDSKGVAMATNKLLFPGGSQSCYADGTQEIEQWAEFTSFIGLFLREQ